MNLSNKYKYKLETHLKFMCEENKEYTNLYSSWSLNKTTYTNILSTIQINYPHYSLHDASHSESIITNIEMLLGEERITKLSPTDTWLILNCAYLHDFGMALLYANIENEWNTKEFDRYLNSIKNSFDKDLKIAVEYITNLKNKINDDTFELSWPIKVRKYVTEIIANYFRGKHSIITKEYLNNLKDWKLDLTQNGLIHDRLIKLIGDISFLHSQNFEDIMKLDYISNGYNSDYIHPRFIAELIRLGDLLDLDNGRFSEYIEKVSGDMPYISKLHKEKHKSTSHILVNSNKIEVRIDCSDYDIYREARNWISWLQEEIRNVTINWTEIIPKDMEWYAPKLTKKELLINGKPDIDGISDLKFEISQKKAFEIIEGSNLYENKLTFIREFIQNALDASKIQMWRDLDDGIYDSWINKPILSLTPFDIDKKIYENYKLKIIINSTNENYIKLSIIDRGTGINLDSLNNMCNVGSIYDEKVKLNQEIEKMPSWLIPTSGFGIGIQSVFLVTDKFKAYTKSAGMNTLEIEFESAMLNGYINVRNSNKHIKKGTEMNILVPEISSFKYTIGSRLYKFIHNEYDPLLNQSLTFHNIIDYIYDNLGATLFPIELDINGKIERIENFIESKYGKLTFEEKNDKYLYSISKNLNEIIIWDKKDSVYMKIGITNYNLNYAKCSVFFKGCNLYKQNIYTECGFNILVDIYGFDTKETLKIDRSKLTKKGLDKLSEILNNATNFYLDKMQLILNNEIEKKSDITLYKELNIFNFIVLCNKKNVIKNFKPQLYKELLDEEEFKFIALVKKKNSFEQELISFKDMIDDFPNVTYMNAYDFSKYVMRKEEYDYDRINDLFNLKYNIINNDKVIIDKNFIDIVKEFFISEIKYINIDEDIIIYIYNIDIYNNEIKIKTDDKTRKHLIKELAEKSCENKEYQKFKTNKVRCSIPAIDGYEMLAVNQGCYSIYGKHNSKFKIISPITKYDRNKIRYFVDKTDFINHIIERDDYKNLLDLIFKYQVCQNKISKDEISKIYQKLIGEFFDILKNEK